MDTKTSWYWNRLRRMSVPEIGYRLNKALHTRAESLGLLTASKVPSPDLSQDGVPFVQVAVPADVQRYCERADEALQGRVPLFALDTRGPGLPWDWNRDPLTGVRAPLSFGKRIDYRDAGRVGDIKYLWEVNRHLHLATLAQAYRLTRQRTYLDAIGAQLESWFEQCPYLQGPNWTSSLELGIRLINWSLAWQWIGGTASPLFDGPNGAALRTRWLESVYQHVHFIRGYFSRYSSANNHLIGEAAGIYVAACTWPYWKSLESWRQQARAILEQEALQQNAPDGVNREQAVSYQQFVLDFLILAGLAGRTNDEPFTPAYWARVEAMLEYLASIMDVAGNVPMIGDADDGYVVRLATAEGWCPYRSLLATGAVLFNRGDFKAKAGTLDEKTRWLLGEASVQRFAAIPTEDAVLPVRRAFPDGGYYILGGNFETPREVRLLVDSGPLGYRAIAAHGHADALAVLLSVGAREFLIDPGTYAYHTEREWRDYFRGTAAHNTLRVDGMNQSQIGGSFLWSRHAQARCEIWEPGAEADRFVGEHDGYRGLADPVVHRREILWSRPDQTIAITDRVDCRETHMVERFWHFSERCQLTVEDSAVVAENDGIRIRLAPMGAPVEVLVKRGDESERLGWVSRRFAVKEPTHTLVWRSRINGATALETRITCFV
jgi:hypothetical protein